MEAPDAAKAAAVTDDDDASLASGLTKVRSSNSETCLQLWIASGYVI